MSITSEIERISSNVAGTYSVLEEMGADMPETRNTAKLAGTAQTVKVVRYDTDQALNETQKAQARNNIGATGVYVGSGSMPAGYNIQIDPEGEAEETVGRDEFELLKSEVNQLSEQKANQSNWTPNMIIGTDANGNMVARANYTEAEKQALMQEIIDNIKVEYPEAHVIYGDVDSENNIVIFGDLPEGIYTLKYESEDGKQTEVGNINLIKEIEIPLTWAKGKLNTSTGAVATDDTYAYSDFVTIDTSRTYTLKLTDVAVSLKVCYYKADGTFISASADNLWANTSGFLGSANISIPLVSGVGKIRLRCYLNYVTDVDSFVNLQNGAHLYRG